MDKDFDTRTFDSHPLVGGQQYFYAIPIALLQRITAAIGRERFDAELLTLESGLSHECGNFEDRVGRWRHEWALYRGLRQGRTTVFSQPDALEGMHPFSMTRLYSDAKLFRTFQCYTGWLLTNKDYLDEHDKLFLANGPTIKRWGIQRGRTKMGELLFGDGTKDPAKDPAWQPYCDQRDKFYFKWRLSGLSGPYLPTPVGFETDGKIPMIYFAPSVELSGLFLLPDIFPVPSRDKLRDAIVEARRQTVVADHLHEWFKIIGTGDKARKQFDRYSRILEIQHYWRILHMRHARAMKKSLGKLEAVFAKWLGVGVEAIHDDLILIRRRLGKDWLKRPCPLGTTSS